MKKYRLYAMTEQAANIASKSLANYNTMAKVIVYPGIEIRDDNIYASEEAYRHAIKVIRRANKKFLKGDDPFTIETLPLCCGDTFKFIDVYVTYTEPATVIIRRAKKGLFNLIHKNVYAIKQENRTRYAYVDF